jgi:replication factor C large subunit
MPRKISDVHGQPSAVSSVLSYIKNFKRGKAALLHGPTGTGKTSCIYAIAEEMNLELIEINASDARDGEAVKQKIGNASAQMSLFGGSKVILVDEIDGVSGTEDRGGLSEITSIIDKSTFPIIMTANDPFDQKFTTLRKKSEMIEFHSLAYPSVLAALKKICAIEKVDFDEKALTSLARRAGGDLRGAINDLQTLCDYEKKLSTSDVDELSSRRQTETIINALMRIFKTTDPLVALDSLKDIDEDVDDIFLWIDENISREYTLPEDLKNAYDNLSLADIFRRRIRRREYWRFLVYISDLLSAGIALSKKEKYHGFNKYQRTTRILNIWQANLRNAKKKAITVKIAKKTHSSKRTVEADTLPYIRSLFKQNKDKAREIAAFLELEKEEIDYLSN